jgi:hypothetical protein
MATDKLSLSLALAVLMIYELEKSGLLGYSERSYGDVYKIVDSSIVHIGYVLSQSDLFY